MEEINIENNYDPNHICVFNFIQTPIKLYHLLVESRGNSTAESFIFDEYITTDLNVAKQWEKLGGDRCGNWRHITIDIERYYCLKCGKLFRLNEVKSNGAIRSYEFIHFVRDFITEIPEEHIDAVNAKIENEDELYCMV